MIANSIAVKTLTQCVRGGSFISGKIVSVGSNSAFHLLQADVCL